MKQAISMYLGGIAFSVDQIKSYNDFKNLGLICPLCREPVFYRAESRERVYGKGVIKTSAACFSHYLTGTTCELHKNCGASPHFVHNFANQGKNQRLKLYNMHLWNMFVEINKLSHKDINFIKKIIGRRRAEEFIEGIVNIWREVVTEVKEHIESVLRTYEDETYVSGTPRDLQPTATKLLKYFKSEKYNRHLHLAICNEVTDYLGTNSGKTVLRKMVCYALVVKTHIDKEKGNEIKVEGKKLVQALANVICINNWLEQINERL